MVSHLVQSCVPRCLCSGGVQWGRLTSSQVYLAKHPAWALPLGELTVRHGQLIVDELTIWIYFRTASKGANVAILPMFIGEATEVPQGHISWKATETGGLAAPGTCQPPPCEEQSGQSLGVRGQRHWFDSD